MPRLRARAALGSAGPDDVIVVFATDPEAPIDLAALAADVGRRLTVPNADGVWRIELAAEQ